MKVAYCPYCGGRTKRNGRTSSGSQRWRCTACGASTTVRYDDTATRLDEFLGWLLSKDSQATMPGGGRSFRRRTAEFWEVWPMPVPDGELHRVLYVDGIWVARDLVVLICCSGERVTRAKAEAVAALRAEGHALGHLLACTELKRSTYYYALAHPPRPTRPELREVAAEIFSRTANGCGHRQIAMCLRAEEGAVIANKTVLKMMREMGIRCGIRRETAYHRYNSYRGVVGRTFENVIARDFDAGAPWQKLGTDVTEFKVAGGKAYWAPTLDFCTKEIVASDISTTPDMSQQVRMLDELLSKIPEGAAPTMHSDRGWQYQHASYTSRLEAAGIVQSMSRKANCIDNAATEQLFGHVKDEFYRGREWKTFEDFKRDLEEYIVHWNTSRRQVRLKGLTPEEFRNQALAA
ncbi:MAG: IS3 family transposase [Collinsella sp.]|nr:IS3 family transposase [Collinsella sp.]